MRLVAFWRHKTFQTLAISVLGVVLFVAVAEGIFTLLGAQSVIGYWAGKASPYRALLAILNPLSTTRSGVAVVSAFDSVGLQLGIALALSLI